jgi:hypothetical protein
VWWAGSGPWIPECGGQVVGPGSQAVGPPEVAGDGGGGVDVQRGFVELAVATATWYPLCIPEMGG